MKKILEFLSENFQFLVVKFSIYLKRHVPKRILLLANSEVLNVSLFTISL